MFKTVIRILTFTYFISAGSVGLTQSLVSASDAQKDLSLMVEYVKEVHYNPFFLSDSNSFNRLFEMSLVKIGESDSILIEDYTLIAMQLLSAINDGHTSINLVSPALVPGLLSHSYINLDLKFEEHPEIRVISGLDSGKVISNINGLESNRLYYESLSCYGGNGHFKRQITQSIFFPIYLHLKNVHAPYTIKFTDGSSTVLNTGISINDLLNTKGVSKPDYTYQTLRNGMGYLAYNSCNDADKFELFLDSTFQFIAQQKVSTLIIDIRENQGGNSALNDMLLNYVTQTPYRQSATRYWKVSDTFKEMITEPQYKNTWGKSFVKQYLKAKSGTILKEDQYELTQPKTPHNYFNGDVCLLIGPQTFSSANFLADAVATYKLMPLIGKPTGENTNDFGEQVSITLPRTQIILQVSIAYDIGADGDQNRVETIDPTVYSEGDALETAIRLYNTIKD